MPETEQELKIATRSGLLSNFRVMREGPCGRLYSADPAPAHASDGVARCLVYVPRPDAQAAYLERLKKIERLAYHGWMIPDSIVRDGALGLAAIYRIEHGTPLSEATEEQLGSLTQRVLLMARLCRILAHGHDTELFHEQLAEDLIICNGGYPMLIDAPVTSDERSTLPYGRATGDIRAIGSILSRITLGPGAPIPQGREPTRMAEEIQRIVKTAQADEPYTRFIQVTEMSDQLKSVADSSLNSDPEGNQPARWKAWLGPIAAVAAISWAVFLMAERKYDGEVTALQGRLLETESQLDTQRQEAVRLADKLNLLPDLQDRGFGLLRFSHLHGVTPDSLLMFAAVEQILWPIGVEQSHLDSRLSFQNSRLLAGRQFIDDAYARSTDNNLEVILTELLVGTWELESGEYHAANDTLRRVAPKLRRISHDKDPLVVGTQQLMSYVSALANGTVPATPPEYEPWVQRTIDIAASSRVNGIGPYGEEYRPFAERFNHANAPRDEQYTRSIMQRTSTIDHSTP